MNPGKVRTAHRRLGISIACFLFVQAIAGMLMSLGRLVSVEMSPPYNLVYFIHAAWDPLGNIYRVVLGLATAIQGVLGIVIFRSLSRLKKKRNVSFPSANQTYALKKEIPMSTLSFAAAIRPLFRSFDIESMKPAGIDLSSYEDVKKKAQSIYARLSAKEMPCDGPWSADSIQKFKEWMDGGMKP
ncbi:MAG: hypothetical protein ABSG44_18475 [Thermodesulfobacteriota bacterium]|jgi:hypothetical protein